MFLNLIYKNKIQKLFKDFLPDEQCCSLLLSTLGSFFVNRANIC